MSSTQPKNQDNEYEDCSSYTTDGTGSIAIRAMADHQSRFLSSNGEATTTPTKSSSKSPPPLQRVERHVGNGDAYYYEEDDYGAVDREEEIIQDATKAVHESHYALLYLLTNPEEFQSVLSGKGLKEWNEEEASEATSTPLPYAVFAPDAEVVLPQAHTASQLFGVETVSGIELEAAAGVVALSQLFLRWLALMPGGDHCNIIDPPGLTVMKIAGGRYRVTGAHRVVWTWLNEFLPEAIPSFGSYSSPQSPSTKEDLRFQFGDLVTMTIIDVFETDKDGKLLSYCPTFDNRSITKTNPTRERLSKESHKMREMYTMLSQSRAAYQVNKAAHFLGRIGLQAALKCREEMEGRLKQSWRKDGSISPAKLPPNASKDFVKETEKFRPVLELAPAEKPPPRSELYVSDDETSRGEQ